MSDELLSRAHKRIGGLGLDITTYGDDSVIVRWRRDYGDVGLSDERQVQAAALSEALYAVISWEDRVDAEEAAEAP